ncbi:cupin [Neisseria meningitidis]|nr:cupin [Neisseria meningitidis]
MSIHLDFGISPKTFRQTYLYQKPKLFKGAVRNLEAASWKDINEIYQRADPTAPLFHLSKKGAIVPKEEYVETFDDLGKTRYRFIKSVIYEHMKNGASLLYNHIIVD